MKESDLLSLLTAEISTPEIEPDEVTAQMLANSAHIGYKKAKDKLEEKVAQGSLKKRMVKLPSGHVAEAYSAVTFSESHPKRNLCN